MPLESPMAQNTYRHHKTRYPHKAQEYEKFILRLSIKEVLKNLLVFRKYNI